MTFSQFCYSFKIIYRQCHYCQNPKQSLPTAFPLHTIAPGIRRWPSDNDWPDKAGVSGPIAQFPHPLSRITQRLVSILALSFLDFLQDWASRAQSGNGLDSTPMIGYLSFSVSLSYHPHWVFFYHLNKLFAFGSLTQNLLLKKPN